MGQRNHELLTYYPVADAIAATFGKNIGIIIYDLRAPQHLIAYTVNNQIVGPIVNNFSVEPLIDRLQSNQQIANYITDTLVDSSLKYSAIPLRNATGSIIGLMCIFVDITRYRQVMELLEDCFYLQPEPPVSSGESQLSIHSVVTEILDSMLENKLPELFDRQERLDIISAMDQCGVFLVKGAIEKVAERLKISKVTIYSYLDELRKDERVLAK